MSFLTKAYTFLTRRCIIRLAMAVLLTLLTGCAEPRTDRTVDAHPRPDKAIDQTDNYWTEERKALYQRAREAGRQARERYIAAKRPALQLKFRHEYPTMTEDEINVLVNDALEEGLRREAERRREVPMGDTSIDCMSSQVGNTTYTNCY